MVKKKIIVFVLLLILPTYLIGDKCGKELKKKSRISGGYQSEPNQYPWMVFFSIIKNNHLYMCAGSLISDKLLLTAKHCTQDTDSWGTARVGVHNWRMNLNDSQEVEFRKVILHETENDNDIAIILIKGPVDLEDPTIGTVCLPQTEKEDYIGESVKGMGWGMVKKNKYWNLLKVVDLKVAKKREKYWLYTNLPKIDGVYQDPCAGDSGSPLVHKKSNQWTIIGTVFGNGYNCMSGKVHGLGKWNKVTDHLKWIKRIMKKYKDDAKETRESGFHGQKSSLIDHYEHGSMENNYRNKSVGNDKINTRKDNFIANEYTDYNQINGNMVNKFRNKNIGNYNGLVFAGNSPVNRYRGNKKINVLAEYNKINVYLSNYQANGYGGNIDINKHIRKNHERSNNKENIYIGNYQVNRHADNNHINGQIRKNHENSDTKENAYVDNYQVNGYADNNHNNGHIRKYHKNSDYRENIYVDNYKVNGYTGYKHINGHIRKNHENGGKKVNAYVDNYHENGYSHNNHINGHIRKSQEYYDMKENAYAGNYQVNGYVGNIPINQHIKKNFKNSDNKRNAYVGGYQVNRFAGNIPINGQIKNNHENSDNRGNTYVDNKNKNDIWIKSM